MYRHLFLIFLVGLPLMALPAQKSAETPSIAEKTKSMKAYEGYFRYFWEEKEGRIWLEIGRWDSEFLYVNSLSAGVGSNDLGLDRNQLGQDRIVRFVRVGPKVLLMQPNYRYRAVSDNPDEQQSVQEAFASSVLWGFKVEAEEEGRALIDLTPMLLDDAHGIIERLKSNKQGTYKVDASRSAVFLERTRNFPKNSEFEAIITLTGEPQGGQIRSVTPTPEAVTVRQHHSFIELPDAGYQPRVFDPRSGYFPLSYSDYATPIEQPLVKRFIQRHRLEKKDPAAVRSEPVEPIIYYLDRGTPEPVRSALLEGARWWNQAFEAAGYIDAFRVEVLPEGADPMDVRYNVINWVHRSTRGWSYGSTVTDPRTGEIIKGHVLLGSLRVRQDFLIAQGLIEAYVDGKNPDPRLLELSLARLRQLAAHEVGHTLGLTHNFAASYNDRASVMDYPHPLVAINDKGAIDFKNAYDTGIGGWDKRTILYGYQDFPAGTDEQKALQAILAENERLGLAFVSDQDARAPGGAHPLGHLWDNGKSAIDELRRLSGVRRLALRNFSEKNIPNGAPMATLEQVLVPLYLAHRYQVEAVSKLVGGVDYTYAVRGSKGPVNTMISDEVQREALKALLETLDPEFLTIPEHIIGLIPPQPTGYSRDRESFKTHTGLTFDPLAAAESAAENTLSLLLHPQRLARVVEQHARNPQRLSVNELLNTLSNAIRPRRESDEYQRELARMVERLALKHLLQLAGDESVMGQVRAEAWRQLLELDTRFSNQLAIGDPAMIAHYYYLREQIELFKRNPTDYKVPEAPTLPDGAPIGCEGMD